MPIETHNPFDAPAADDVEPDLVDPVGFEPEGDRLWIPALRPWPRWCIHCGAPAAGIAYRTLRYRPVFRLGWSVPVNVPLCRRHLEAFRRRSRIAGALLVLAVATLFVGHAVVGAAFVLVAMGLFALAGMVKGEGLLAVKKDGGRYLVAGVSRAYLERLRDG